MWPNNLMTELHLCYLKYGQRFLLTRKVILVSLCNPLDLFSGTRHFESKYTHFIKLKMCFDRSCLFSFNFMFSIFLHYSKHSTLAETHTRSLIGTFKPWWTPCGTPGGASLVQKLRLTRILSLWAKWQNPGAVSISSTTRRFSAMPSNFIRGWARYSHTSDI